MADPLSITSGIVAVLQLTGKVISYLRDVDDAGELKKRLLLEISATKGILQTLNDLATGATKGDAILSNIESLEEPLTNYESLLAGLDKSLSPGRGLKRVGQALKWPFEKGKVLEDLAAIERCKTLFGLALHADHLELSRAIKQQAIALRDSQREQELRDVVQWLSPLDFASKHELIFSKHEQGTGRRLLDDPAFEAWESAASRLLWCPGVPGAGKTVFASIAIEHLKRRAPSVEFAVLGMYCDYKDFSHQSPWKFLASLLQQIISQQGRVPEQVMNAYTSHTRRQTHPTFPEYLDMVTVQINTFKRVYVVIDALDECTEIDGVREDLLEGILQLPTFVSVMVTSRYIPTIEEMFKGSPRLTIKADDEDIHAHVKSRLGKEKTWARRIRLDEKLSRKIGQSVVARASGMFLLAQLHITSIMRKHSRKDIEKALKELPAALYSAYDQIWQRIDDQGEDSAGLARQVLAWLSHARRPLTADMLQQALAIRPRDIIFDEDAVVHEETFLDVCAGLVVIDPNTRVIQYVHYTTQEYFSSRKTTLFPEYPLNIASTCLTFLLFDEGTKSNMADLYKYIAANWGHHARDSPEDAELVTKIVAFLQNDARLRHCVHHMSDSHSLPNSLSMSGLHLAANFDLAMTMSRLLENDASNVNMQDEEGRTPLYFAAAAEGGSVVKLLLQRSDVQVDLSSFFHGSPLHSAIDAGQEDTAQVLLAQGANAETPDSQGQRPIHKAIKLGLARTLEALIAQGVDLTATTHTGHTPLELVMPYDSKLRQKTSNGIWRRAELGAETHEYTPCLKMLLDAVSLDDVERGHMLFEAVKDGRPDIVDFFISKGATTSTKNPVFNQRTPLHWACEKGFTQIVGKLLACGSDPMVQDARGCLPLHYAASAGREDAVKLLVRAMRDFNTRANSGMTAVQLAKLQGRTSIAGLIVQAGGEDLEPPSNYHSSAERRHSNATKRAMSGPSVRFRTLSGQSISGAEYDRYTERFLAAARYGDVETVLLCLSKGVEIEERDPEHSKTALHWAAENGYADITQLLLDWGGDLSVQDQYGETPLHYAADSGHVDIIEAINRRNPEYAVLDDRGRSPLRCARDNYHTPAVKVLMKFWDGSREQANEIDAQGKSLAHWAAEVAEADVCRRLLALGLGDAAFKKDNRGLTVVDYARKHGVGDIVMRGASVAGSIA